MAYFGLWVSGKHFKKSRKEENKAQKTAALVTPRYEGQKKKKKRWAVDKSVDKSGVNNMKNRNSRRREVGGDPLDKGNRAYGATTKGWKAMPALEKTEDEKLKRAWRVYLKSVERYGEDYCERVGIRKPSGRYK